MFQDVHVASLRFKGKETKTTAEASTMTSAVAVAETEMQTDGGLVESTTQTDPKVTPSSTNGSNGLTKSKDGGTMINEDEMTRASSFVQRIGPMVLRELSKSRLSFQGFERYLEASEEKNIAKLFTLSFDYDTYFQLPQSAATETHDGLGNFGTVNHAFNPHPKNPALVAAGSFNGEVFVWDLEPEEYRFYSSGIGDYFHREPVTKVTWVYDVQAAEYNVASVSGDGKILFWRLKDKLSYPVEGYVMHVPNEKVTAADKLQVMGGKALGFCLHDKTSRSFVAGSEGGAIIRCFSQGNARSADFKGDKKWTATAARLVGKLPTQRLASVRRQVEAYATEKKTKEITLAMVYEAKIDPNALYPSALDFVFEPHGGPIYDVQFSPFRKSLFLTCSSDGTARLYTYLQKEPIVSFDVTPSSSYLYAIEWSKTRPTVFAVAAEDGNVYVYDLKHDRINPIVVLSGKDAPLNASNAQNTKTSASPMFAVDFNPRQRNFLAAGDANGQVHIWKLSWQLANLQTGEATMLEALEVVQP